DAEDVGQGDLQALVAREVDADEACHLMSSLLRRRCRTHRGSAGRCAVEPRPPSRGWPPRSAVPMSRGCWCVAEMFCWGRASRCRSVLTLLVPQVVADDPDPAVPADHFALVADGLDARLDLHRGLFRGRVPATWQPLTTRPCPISSVVTCSGRRC